MFCLRSALCIATEATSRPGGLVAARQMTRARAAEAGRALGDDEMAVPGYTIR